MPAATDFRPSTTMAWASTVAVVVPSPALSLVFEATSRISWAPRFSNRSSSSISLATVTPSLVERGAAVGLLEHHVAALGAQGDLHRVGEGVDAAQHAVARVGGEVDVFGGHLADLSKSSGVGRRSASRPQAAFASAATGSSTPRMSVSFMISRSSPSILTSLPDHLPNRMRSPAFDVDGDALAVVVPGAGADGDDLAFLRLFLGVVGNDDPALGLGFFFDASNDDAIAQRTKGHVGILR